MAQGFRITVVVACLSVCLGTGEAAVNWHWVDGAIRPGIGYLDQGPPIRTLQGDLTQLDYFRGVVDGYFGWLTLDGLQTFQRDHGLPPSSRLDAAFGARARRRLGRRRKRACPNRAARAPHDRDRLRAQLSG